MKPLKSLLCTLLLFVAVNALGDDPRPNILWITLEDIGPDLGCYDLRYADTPNIDRLALEGTRYTRAWSNAGMCAPARATLITGMYPPGIGTQNMRSEVRTPEFVRAFSEYLRQAGYFTSNHDKTDYNWAAPKTTWTVQSKDWFDDGWRRRGTDQPFFTVINIGDTHASQMYWRGEEKYQRRVKELGPKRLCHPDEVDVPPYYPDQPEIRAEIARYQNNISYADGVVGEILDQLDDDGLADTTIVFLFSDHGPGFPRSKGWCFYSSLHVPLIVRVPQAFRQYAPSEPGHADDRIVSFVDFGPTVLSLGGIEPPSHMQGQPFLGEFKTSARRLAFSYRDRMDERFDLIRSVWDGRFHYIRNYFPRLPWFHGQTRYYPHTQASYQVWQEFADMGRLQESTAIYMAHEKPAEMLFDTQADPHELNNLVSDPAYATQLEALRTELRDWQDGIIDLGFMPESMWHERLSDRDSATRYETVRQQPGLYPLQQLRQLADRLPNAGHTAAMLKAFQSDNRAEQFWGGMGLLANHVDNDTIRAELHRQLDNPSPTIAVISAQALAELGETEASLPILLRVLDHDDPLIGLRAANAIDQLGQRARPVLQELVAHEKQLSKLDMREEPLGKQFIHWTLQHTLETFSNQ
ncbi:Arylsulfatase [Crateriforma conspicua]|uniref:Arylsulfatase n=1 Tax=Crateriforma conspicua TaxID=2527996 RepID=A0A5C6FMN7_9PLAN|nr:sulfatase-like hydrolase/transferase [Crateriforma conspicua]TWU62554.1 Arylsulfatase [Crateriforma conspicua]